MDVLVPLFLKDSKGVVQSLYKSLTPEEVKQVV